MPNAMMMQTMDNPMGARAATRVPNRTTRMIMATGMPMRSPRLKSVSDSSLLSWAVLASPTMSTRKPSLPLASSTT